MESRSSLLNADHIDIPDTSISIRIPTVGEILEDEYSYYGIVNALTAVPYQFMVQLDDMGIDFTKITDYQLFQTLFPLYGKADLSILFGDFVTNDYKVFHDHSKKEDVLYSPTNGKRGQINYKVYLELTDAIRKINLLEKFRGKPGNEAAKKYLLEKERRRIERHANDPREPYLEKLVIALVNRPEFKYNYDETMSLSIYRFNQSFRQVQTSITFDKTMIGVYAGTVDASKLSDKSCLSWLQIK